MNSIILVVLLKTLYLQLHCQEYYLDMTNTIRLDKNVTYLKQFPTSEIFVQYTDGSSFLYDLSFNLIRQINILNSYSTLYSLTVSDSGKYAYGSSGGDPFVLYSFDTESSAKIFSVNA